MRYFHFIMVLLCSMGLFVLQSPTTYALAPSGSLEEKVEKLEEQVKENQLSFLQDEIKNYRQAMEADRVSLLTTLEIWLTVFTLFISFIIAFCTHYFRRQFGESKKELFEILRHDMRVEVMKQTDQLNKEHVEGMAIIKSKMEKNLLDMDSEILKQKDEVEKHQLTLEQIINKERAFVNTRIMVIGSERENERMKIEELPSVYKRGIGEDQVIFLNTNISEFRRHLSDRLQMSDYDIIIYSYARECQLKPHDNKNCKDQGDKKCKDIEENIVKSVAKELLAQKKNIPLLIYTYKDFANFINKNDQMIVEEYLWTTYANYPATLVGHLFTLAHAFNREMTENSK
ncbi:hypothetical protein IC619_006970 [Hazenella sp. IB182353]|uniref:hypothetical protein n=1 Tax=Polycladospora coralii TaxID=2771432 RepID=UPI001745CC01|nr:hypothetical protein [Polycladospora coralii]MBS7530233.1 hypothetical protein [Polycladospora coralii]